MIDAIEAALTARVEALLPFLKVEPYPGAPETYRLVHRRGAVLILYTGSDYGPSRPTDLVRQEREAFFDLVLQIRSLHAHEGAYAALDTLRKGLTGWRAPNARGKTTLGRDRFTGAQDGVFQYVTALKIPLVNVEVLAPLPPAPPGLDVSIGSIP